MEKKKFSWAGALMVIIGLSGGMLISLALSSTNIITDDDSIATLTLKISGLFVAFFIAAYLQVIIHEAGHLVAGLKTGYHFVSFRIGRMMWVKNTEGNIIRKSFELSGTAGQCIMGPPEYSEHFKTTLYNYGGVIANAVASLICLILYFAIPVKALKMFNFVMIICGLMNVLLNGIPLVTSAVANDGYNEKECRKSEKARRAFWSQLKVTELLSQGLGLQEMPQELFDFEPDRELILVNSSYVMKINQYMTKDSYRQCRKMMEEFLKGDYKTNPLHTQMLETDLLYCRIIDGEDTSYDYAGMANFFAKTKTVLSVIRTQYAYEKVAMRNEAMADAYLKRFEKQAANYPYEKELEAERGLIALADSKVYNKEKVGK